MIINMFLHLANYFHTAYTVPQTKTGSYDLLNTVSQEYEGLYFVDIYDPHQVAFSDIVFYRPVKWQNEGEDDYGGAPTTRVVSTNEVLFDRVTGDQAATGMTEYRKIFLGVDSAAETNIASDPKVLISFPYTVNQPQDRFYIKEYVAGDDTNVLSDITATPESSWVRGVFDPGAAARTNPGGVLFPAINSNLNRGFWIKRAVPVGCNAFNDRRFGLVVKLKYEKESVYT